MTPTDCLLQNLEQGPLTYTELRYNQLGLDVRSAAAQCLKTGTVDEVWDSFLDDSDEPQRIRQVTWTITKAGVTRMEELRNPPEPSVKE